MTKSVAKITKEIAYSYPTSINAENLGFGDTGCWHLSITYIDIEGSGQCRTFMPHDAEGFASKDDPDLLAMLDEYTDPLGKAVKPSWVQ